MNPNIEWLSGPTHRHTRLGVLPKYREGLYRLGRHSHAWIVPNGAWGESNSGIIRCINRSILVDTGWDPDCAKEMLDGVDVLLDGSPITHVINTHADGDHCWGNQCFSDRHILATRACRDQMRLNRPGHLALAKLGCSLLKWLPVAGWNRLGQYLLRLLAPYQFSLVRLTLPNDVFTGERTLSVNGIDVVVMELGPGHSDGDSIVYVPADKVVFAGDFLYVNCTPVARSGPVDNVIQALRTMLSLKADVFVPGHGPVAGRAQVQAAIDYWEYIQKHLRACFDQGVAPERASKAVLELMWRQRKVWCYWEAPERLVTNAWTLYREWGYAPRRVSGRLATLNMLRHQARLADHFGELTREGGVAGSA
ncbi:MAG: MBL fold metallo-hydrolase [Pseudomonadota bacterium]